MPTTEETFDLLADAAQVRYPTPDRENRGLCPAHDDHNNPGLVFRISATTGNLVVHCFARECSAEDIAAAIGVPLGSFFPGNTTPGQVRPTVVWKYVPVLELLKLLPLNYSWEEQIEAVFRTMEADYDIGYLEHPYHEVPFTIMRDVLLYAYAEPHWRETGAPWWNDKRTGYSDQAMRMLGQLSRDTRTNNLSQESTIPLGASSA